MEDNFPPENDCAPWNASVPSPHHKQPVPILEILIYPPPPPPTPMNTLSK